MIVSKTMHFLTVFLKNWAQLRLVQKTLAFSLLFFSGCSHLGTVVHKEKISNVRRVAIVGFSVMRKHEEEKELSSYNSQHLQTKSQQDLTQRIETAIFNSLAQSLEKKIGWEVLSPAELMTSKTFTERYKSLPEKVRKINKIRSANSPYDFNKRDVDILTVDHVLDFDTSAWLTSKDLMIIAQELKVDAFGFFVENQIVQTRLLEPVQLIGRIKKFRHLGDHFKVKSVSSLRVVSPDKKEVVLQVQNRFGPKLSNNDFSKNVTYQNKLRKLCLASSQSAMNMIMSELY